MGANPKSIMTVVPGLHFGSSKLSRIIPVLVLVATSVFAYGMCGTSIGWISDDYNEVFGVTNPVPDWRNAVLIGGSGHFSPYRLLKYPIEGYLGYWLGPGHSHELQFISHLICVLLFYFLLKRIKWSTPASLAAGMLFCSMPWMSEAVYWWSAATTIWATILVLGAAHCLISWQDSNSKRWIFAYAGLVFLSLVMYELWLGGFIFFAVLVWYYRAVEKVNRGTAKEEPLGKGRESFGRYGKLALPFIVYTFLYFVAPSQDAASRIYLPLAQLPRSIAMVHLRALQWPVDTAWHWTFMNAGTAFNSSSGWFCITIEIAILGLLCYAWAQRFPPTDLISRGTPLWHSLVLGWSIFAGSRIALVLQSFISRYDTRQNYAASMGIAIAVVACISSLLESKFVGRRIHVAVGVAILAIVFVLGWTSTGIGIHYVMTTRAEAQTIHEINDWIAVAGHEHAGLTLVVTPDMNAISHGTVELSYFNEHDGTWLDFVVKKQCQNCTVFVTDEAECVAKRRMIELHDPVTPVPVGLAAAGFKNRWWLGPPAVLFRWTGQDLVPESVSCR